MVYRGGVCAYAGALRGSAVLVLSFVFVLRACRVAVPARAQLGLADAHRLSANNVAGNPRVGKGFGRKPRGGAAAGSSAGVARPTTNYVCDSSDGSDDDGSGQRRRRRRTKRITLDPGVAAVSGQMQLPIEWLPLKKGEWRREPYSANPLEVIATYVNLVAGLQC